MIVATGSFERSIERSIERSNKLYTKTDQLSIVGGVKPCLTALVNRSLFSILLDLTIWLIPA
jgi:hypothetical protein